MRYLAVLKGNAVSEAGYVPTEEDMAGMGAFIDQAMQAGWLLATEGLLPSARATRVALSAGQRTVTDGPFTESKELIASYALMQVDSREEAIEHTWSFLDMLGEGEVELWPVFEVEAPHAG
ncbi:MAG TPA: YciI family protein [Thermomicrobiaceae bacterium]|nr:YciI family protein [Thermomicrobiaceae bacterium]